MNDLDHRPGVKEINLVRRNLKLEGVTEDNREAIILEIDTLVGIESVSFDASTATINMAYDATHCDLDGIEALLQVHGADTSQGLWTKIKEGYYKFVDQNIKDNDEHDPHCCNAMPKALPGSRKK